jgi:hypothetical protein
MDPTRRAWWEQRAKERRPATVVVPSLSELLAAQDEGEACLGRLRRILDRVRELKNQAAVLRDQIRKGGTPLPHPKVTS